MTREWAPVLTFKFGQWFCPCILSRVRETVRGPGPITTKCKIRTPYLAVSLMLILFKTRVRGIQRYGLRFLNFIALQRVLARKLNRVGPFPKQFRCDYSGRCMAYQYLISDTKASLIVSNTSSSLKKIVPHNL